MRQEHDPASSVCGAKTKLQSYKIDVTLKGGIMCRFGPQKDLHTISITTSGMLMPYHVMLRCILPNG